jgi:2-succinyl-5-enolpyruvyl-6-hydroxy-3-cyclohexene-1-carboxylate synthase
VGAERQEMTHATVMGRYLGAFVDELAAAGLEHLCLCPGSRSTPLALLFSQHPRIKVWMHLDERSCAYFALGMARVSRRPVALLSTSGTATVNFAPAVVEAMQSRVPLLVLTADRPPELRDLGANQTIDQVRLYGSASKWSLELPLPEASDAALRHVRVVAGRALDTALSEPPGPVHLNFPLREPLVPERGDFGAAPREPLVRTSRAPRRPQPEVLAPLVEAASAAQHGLIVCGPQDDAALADAVTLLAARLGWPLLADPISGVRNGPHYQDVVLASYDNYLRDPALSTRLTPDFVLRFGAAPTSKPLSTYLQRHQQARQVLVSPDTLWRDPELTAGEVVFADAASLCQALCDTVPQRATSEAWLRQWQAAEQASLRAIDGVMAAEEQATEPGVFHALADLLPEGSSIFAGNSMPVRDLDSFFAAGPADIRILANRGASGIDGVVSSALGAAALSDGRLVLVIGDLSFYHDMNGLLAAKRFAIDATIVLVNNDGGGIFSFLSQHDDPEQFEALFGTPHGLDFRPVADLYGLDYRRVETTGEYRDEIKATLGRPGVTVIEVPTDREENLALHRRIWQAVSAAVDEGTSK